MNESPCLDYVYGFLKIFFFCLRYCLRTSLSNATSGTHFYFDNECAAGQSYLER